MESCTLKSSDSLHITEFPHDGIRAYLVTVDATESTFFSVFERIKAAVEERGARIVFQYLFARRHVEPSVNAVMGAVDWPVTLLDGGAGEGPGITGTQVVALAGAELQPVADGDRTVGYWYDTAGARFCLLGDLRGDDLSLSREAQAESVLVKMERLLGQIDMAFTDIARTWIYLADLLDWYDEFNVVRTRFFTEHEVFEKMVPASTGIGAGTAAGEAMVAALLAVKPRNDSVKVFAVPSPLQCPALDYNSSFARAVEIDLPGSRLLTISGTASIEPEGKTVHIGNCEKQVALTMAVVLEILKSRDLDWENICRGIAYFKHVKDAHLFRAYCEERSMPELPVAISHAHVCRDDLLFEIEVDAIEIR